MKTIIVDYPQQFSFKTKKTFTTNEERTKHLQQVLRRKNIESPSHDYNDYVVEETIRVFDKTDFWIVGS